MNYEAILKCKEVSSSRLYNLSFEVFAQQITTVIGPSGAGKSSLLMLLNRLEEPEKGTILYRDKPLDDYEITTLRCQIGMVFQNAYLFDGTVEKNIEYGPNLHKSETVKIDKQRLLELVDLPGSYLLRDVTSLSGGEQQRVAIARTLANKPSVLLLDEATSALDIKTAEKIEELLMKLKNEHQITVMMVTHNLHQAKRMGNHTLFFQEGKLIESGETNAIFSHPETEELKQFLKE